jgi:hypothetical protein
MCLLNVSLDLAATKVTVDTPITVGLKVETAKLAKSMVSHCWNELL